MPGDLFRMYSRYAESQHWKVEVLSTSESGAGGLKEVIAMVEGRGAYSKLKYEGGVHRVQRVPATETARTHSYVNRHRGSDAGSRRRRHQDRSQRPAHRYLLFVGTGWPVREHHVSAVRITHIPTNTVVSCQDEKSQIKNREKGMRVLRSRLYEIEQQKQQEALSKERKSMVGSGDRSEKIRTYNFQQNSLTDHRIGFTIHQLEAVMDGKLQPFVEALITYYHAEN